MIDYEILCKDIEYRKRLLEHLSNETNLDDFCILLKKSVSEDRMFYHGVECDIYCHKMYNMTTKKLTALKFEASWTKSISTTYEEKHFGFIFSIHPNGMKQDFIYNKIIDNIIKIYTRDMRIGEIFDN